MNVNSNRPYFLSFYPVLCLDNFLLSPLVISVTLTKIGIEISDTATQLLDLARKIKTVSLEHATSNENLEGELIIYTVPSLNNVLLPEVIDIYYKKHPRVNVVIIERSISEIFYNLNKDETADIGLVVMTSNISDKFLAGNENKIIYQPLMHDQLFAVVPKESPLKSKNFITMTELLKYPLAVYDGVKQGTVLCSSKANKKKSMNNAGNFFIM